MSGTCPDCGFLVRGGFCARCGAVGTTSWVCFHCGKQNPREAETCACGFGRVIECGACGVEVDLRAETCPACRTPKFAFEAAEEAQRRGAARRRLRESVRALEVALVALVLAALYLIALEQRPLSRAFGAGLLVLAALGAAHAAVTERHLRRELN